MILFIFRPQVVSWIIAGRASARRGRSMKAWSQDKPAEMCAQDAGAMLRGGGERVGAIHPEPSGYADFAVCC